MTIIYSNLERSDYQAELCRRISNTINPMSVGKSQILSSRQRDVTNVNGLSYLETVCFIIPHFRIILGGNSSSVLVVDQDFFFFFFSLFHQRADDEALTRFL